MLLASGCDPLAVHGGRWSERRTEARGDGAGDEVSTARGRPGGVGGRVRRREELRRCRAAGSRSSPAADPGRAKARRAMAALRDALAARHFVSQPSAVAKLVGEQSPAAPGARIAASPRVFARFRSMRRRTCTSMRITRGLSPSSSAAIAQVHRNPEILREAEPRAEAQGLGLLASVLREWAMSRATRTHRLMPWLAMRYCSKFTAATRTGARGEAVQAGGRTAVAGRG